MKARGKYPKGIFCPLFFFVYSCSLNIAKIILKPLEGLILAQSERWRRGLGMQVERSYFCFCGGVTHCRSRNRLAANG